MVKSVGPQFESGPSRTSWVVFLQFIFIKNCLKSEVIPAFSFVFSQGEVLIFEQLL